MNKVDNTPGDAKRFQGPLWGFPIIILLAVFKGGVALSYHAWTAAIACLVETMAMALFWLGALDLRQNGWTNRGKTIVFSATLILLIRCAFYVYPLHFS